MLRPDQQLIVNEGSFEVATFAVQLGEDPGRTLPLERFSPVVDMTVEEWIDQSAASNPQVDRVLSFTAIRGQVQIDEELVPVSSARREIATTFIKGIIFPARPKTIGRMLAAWGQNIGSPEAAETIAEAYIELADLGGLTHVIQTRTGNIGVFNPTTDRQYMCKQLKR